MIAMRTDTIIKFSGLEVFSLTMSDVMALFAGPSTARQRNTAAGKIRDMSVGIT